VKTSAIAYSTVVDSVRSEKDCVVDAQKMQLMSSQVDERIALIDGTHDDSQWQSLHLRQLVEPPVLCTATHSHCDKKLAGPPRQPKSIVRCADAEGESISLRQGVMGRSWHGRPAPG